MVVGDTSLLGNVTVGGVVEFQAESNEGDLSTLPAQPWTISHVANDADNHELRIQMDGPHGSANHEVVIGTWTMVPQDDGSQEQQFSPCLTIGSDCKVTVHGDLVVEGDLLDKARNIRQLGDSELSDSARRWPTPPSAAAWESPRASSRRSTSRSPVVPNSRDERCPASGTLHRRYRVHGAAPDPVSVRRLDGLAAEQFPDELEPALAALGTEEAVTLFAGCMPGPP